MKAGASRMTARVPAGLLGMLAIVAAVETGVARAWESITDCGAFSWRLTADAVGTDAVNRAAVLCFGDSLAKHGLVPEVLAPGGRAYNLASAGSPAAWTYFVLRRAVEAGATPEAVVVEFKPALLSGSPKYGIRLLPEVLTPRETVELLSVVRSVRFASELLVGLALPSVRARHDLRAAVRSAVRGERPVAADVNAVCRRHWTRHDGAMLSPRIPGFAGAVDEAQHRSLLSHRFTLHRINAEFVRRTLDFAAARGLRTYLLVPPDIPEATVRRAETGADADYERYLGALAARYPTVTVLDARGSAYPAVAFADYTHLNRYGAVTLSADVGAALRAGHPPGGRVRLPAYRELPQPPAVEDFEESRVALGITWRR